MLCSCLQMEAEACQLAHTSISHFTTLPIHPHPPVGSLMKSLSGSLVGAMHAPCG
jgi:hypothetical protein